MSGTQPPTLGPGSAQLADNRAGVIVRLPNPDGSDPESGPDGWFLAGDVLDDAAQRIIRGLASNGLIERERRGGGRKTSNVHQWRVKDRVYERAQKRVERIETLPCGHTGIRNVRGGGFECKQCGETISREEAKAVIG